MKRRQFLQSIGATGAVAAVPGVALSGGASISGAVYAKAVYYTRLWGASVPEMYTSALGLDLAQAQQVFGQLVRDKVIAAPNASGIASAVSPFFKVPVMAQSVAQGVAQPASSVRGTAKASVRQLDDWAVDDWAVDALEENTDATDDDIEEA